VRSLKVAGRFEQFDKVSETVARVARDLAPGKTLIGFCGAPWTVASYMIEGGSSKRQQALKVAEDAPGWFVELIDRLVEVSVLYLRQQVEAGAEVLQIFDSWAGDIPANQRKQWIIDPIARIVAGVRQSYPGVPVIAFARGVGQSHVEIASGTAANAVSVEQGCDLADLLSRLPLSVSIQGNLDPDLLLGGGVALRENVYRICSTVPMARHIFNIGHGITPQTDPAVVGELLALIRDHDRAA
jgi:uroporphyrinogen decarboxylase